MPDARHVGEAAPAREGRAEHEYGDGEAQHQERVLAGRRRPCRPTAPTARMSR